MCAPDIHATGSEAELCWRCTILGLVSRFDIGARCEPGATSARARGPNRNAFPQFEAGILTCTMASPNARALAVKFQLPDGKNADILALHIEGFPARTPEEFLAFLRAQLPDPATGKPAPDAVPRFLESHPATRAFIERLTKKPVPVSYGQACYYAEHAFRFTAADGSSRFGRYRWTPEAGEVYLSPDDASKRSANFLREELESRLRNGPVAFRLLLQLAGESDPTDDATALWPADRPLVELGRLEVTRISPTSAADERRLVFDPTNVTDGIGLSADPIPLARSAAYSISYDHR